MTDREKEIGANVRLLRGGRSQQSVADQMRLWDHEWSQATVWSVETGKRPLKLAEALDLAHVLDVDLDELIEPAEAAAFRAKVREAEACLSGLIKSAQHLYGLQLDLLTELGTEASANVPRSVVSAAQGVATTSLARVITEMEDKQKPLREAAIKQMRLDAAVANMRTKLQTAKAARGGDRG